MSGIVGILSQGKLDFLPKMQQKIEHRGTSDFKIWRGKTASIGATAITISEQQSGPLTTPSNNRSIVFDGKLINKTYLQEFLKSHSLKEKSDAEAILHAYEEKGPQVFENLEGEFALAIIDDKQLVLARDRLGIRPLYYGFYEGHLCFASEIKALADWIDVVHEFPPGNSLLSETGMFPYGPYFPDPVKLNSALDSAEQLADILREAVHRSIPEGIEIGVWLSGGVDSSVVAALASTSVQRLHTFSAGTKNAPDLMYARQVAKHIGSIHHERIYQLDDMLKVLDKVIYHLESFDAPLVRSAIANYLLSELCSNFVPFVLSGEGGDELFAGYAHQKDCNSEIELTLSIQEAISALHNTALQRVDRSAAAFSTNVAVPFLDPDVVRFALAVPSRWKIRGKPPVEKWPLRRGLAEELPDSVIWREKSKFWQGAGSANLMADHAEQVISDREFESECGKYDFQISSKEELLYYRIFKRYFGEKVPFSEIGRTQHI